MENLGGMHMSRWWLTLIALTVAINFVASGAVMGTSSYLQANLGWMPFNLYNTTNLAGTSGFGGTVNGTYYSSCPSGASVEGCFQTIMGQLRAQAVTGVRIFIPLCDAFPTCGPSASWNPGQNQAQQTWITNVGNFFYDVKTAGIQNVTITITGSGPIATVPASQTWSPAYPASMGGSCSICGECTGDVGTNVEFDPLVPFGMSDGTTNPCTGRQGTAGFPLGDYWTTSSNNGYSYAPVNNQNFIGWTNYFNAINAVLQKASGVVNIYGLEISQELAPGTFTALARYFYDNSSPGTAPPQYVQTVNGVSYVNVFAALRSLMSSNSFDPGRVFYSAPWQDANTTTDNCANAYQDYARATNLDETTQTINGGPIGVPSGMTVINGLLCGGVIDSSMINSPIYSSQPDIVDVHVYPQVAGTTNTDAMVQQVAAIDYGDIPHFLNEAGLTSAAIVIGETWGGTLSPLYLGPGPGYCWSGNYQFPSGTPNDNVAGFNNENVSNPLSAYTVTFRPWMNLEWLSGACFNYGSGPGSSNNYQTINYNGQGPYTPTNQ
jgi:hypothetical protein